MNWSHLLFSFNGRINRAKWWLFILIYVIWVVLATWVISPAVVSAGGDVVQLWGIVALIIGLAFWFMGAAAGTKRLHDRNKTGWWLLLFWLVPLILLFVGAYDFVMSMVAGGMTAATNPGQMPQVGTLGLICMLGAVGIWIWYIIELGALPGTKGDNQYGADPLAGQA